MNKITTLGKVFNRVDALSQNCFDQHINVKDISFDNLDSVKIAGEAHPMRTIAQRSITWRLGIPFQYMRKCPPEIQSVNLNYWIEHEKNEQLFFRFDGRVYTAPDDRCCNLLPQVARDLHGSVEEVGHQGNTDEVRSFAQFRDLLEGTGLIAQDICDDIVPIRVWQKYQLGPVPFLFQDRR